MSRGAGKLEQADRKIPLQSRSQIREVRRPVFGRSRQIIAGPWQPIAVWVALRAPLGGATLAVKFGGKDRVNE
jgi:hypothetical protein